MEPDGGDVGSKKRRRFKRRIWGYQRAAVDQHLTATDLTVQELAATIGAAPSERSDLVLRATRLSVEAVMADAHHRAARIIEAAIVEVDEQPDASDVIDLRQAVEPVESA